MELKDTIELMNSQDYQDRYRGEYYQLKIRYEKLMAMLEKYKAGTLHFTPTCSYELLFEQAIYMKQYLGVLEQRAKIENVNLA
jgi:hypothetical protein